jgi:hypothetical protein
VAAVLYSLLRLLEHLIFGGSTSAGNVVLGALVFFVVCLLALPVCDGISRWWHEAGDSQAP